MDLAFQTILTSPIFMFKIGASGTEMRLPKALISDCSPVLERLVNGDMSEARNGVAVLGDVDEATFADFGKWLYTGDYSILKLYEIEHTSPSARPVPWDHGLSPLRKRKKERVMRANGTWDNRVTESSVDWYEPCQNSSKGSKKQDAWAIFIQQSKHQPSVPPRTNSTANYPDMTEEFFSHARLYCFADKYGIVSLKDLCLENLKASLIECECQTEQMQGVMELLSFTAVNTPPLGDENNENLRSLVLDFVIIVFEHLSEKEAFLQLLEDGGEIVKEILLFLQRRLD